jgi:hypothetical protein
MPRLFRSRAFPLVFLVVTLAVPFNVQTQGSSPCDAAGQPPGDRPAGAFDLELAKRYEKMSRWKEAEQEYIQAARVGAPCIAKEALAAVERLKFNRASDDQVFDLDLARKYEAMHEWKDAEQHYAAAGKDAPLNVREESLDGAARMRGKPSVWLQELVDTLDRYVGYLARFLVLLIIIQMISLIRKNRTAVQFMPFESTTDGGAKLILFWISSARDGLPNLLAPVRRMSRSNVVDALPLIILPGIDNLPDPAQNLTFGPATLPLANLIPLVNVPIVRVYGRWVIGQTTGTAQAQIKVRKGRFSSQFNEEDSGYSNVDSAASPAQDRQLALFGYDVLVKAIYARDYATQ